MTDWLTPKRAARLKRHLDALPELATLADVVASTLLPRRGTPGGSRPHPGSRPPVSLATIETLDGRAKYQGRYAGSGIDTIATSGDDLAIAAQLDRQCGERREGILRNLGDWVRIAAEEMDEEGAQHTDPAETPTITTEAGWLSMHLGWIVQQQWVEELEQDVRRMHRELATIIGEGRPEYRPRCGCGARMRDEGAFFTCPNCGQQVRDSAMDHRTALAREQPMDAYSFAPFGATPEAIRKWVERGLLEQAIDDQGKPIMRGKRHTYWPLDVLRLIDAGRVRA